MRKKFIKSSRPTYKKRIRKGQTGMRFVSYNAIDTPTIDYTDITNPINPFSEYNFNTVYDKPEALVVPVRDTNEPDVVANNPTVEPVINKPVASKPVTDKPVTANSTWKSPYTNRKQWSTELINAYKKAGITNDNAIRMLLAQDALESSWGKSAQGKYNFGNLTTGSSWKGDYVTGNDKNAKGEAIKQKFRSYNSMDEYAADKIQFLKRLYDFDENDDINKFVAKLTGSNKGKRRYAEATNYAKVLTGVYNGIPKGENGMIIKYQEPAQPIKYMGGYDKRGNMVLPVTNENGMNNVTLPEVTVTPRNINLAGAVDRGRREAAPYVSTLLTGAIFGPLSVAGGYAGNEAVNKITNVASNDKYKDWADMLSKTGGPRLQALMKDNIVSEDEFVKRIMKEHPEYNEVSVRNKYKYLTIPSEFNSQLHPLIEFEQRAGKSGVPNFKSVDEIDRLINNNPYVGTSENNGLRNLRLLFNYIIKDKNEFMRRFNKYGFGVVPATTIINNYDNE